MELRQTLRDISNDARGWLTHWAKDFAQAEAVDSGGAAVNPLAWQLGHLACTEDEVYQLFAGGDSILPTGIREICGTGCPPPTAQTEYPGLSELWELLDRTHNRLLSLIDGDLEQAPLKENPHFKSVGQAVYELALHENYHVGEIGVLRKQLGKKKIG